jgi:DNA-binding HxlR family transcriptional regulator
VAGRADLFDGCPTSHALDLIGERWALLVVRELLLGPKRFTDLRRSLPRISRNVLSQRLVDLEAAGVLARRTLPPPSASAVYELTERGLQLEPVMHAIGRWGVESPSLPPSDTISVDTFVLGLRAHYEPPDEELSARYELRVGEQAFAFLVDRGRLSVRRGACDDADRVVIDVDPAAMAAISRGDAPLASALSGAAGASAGDVAAFARRFKAAERPGAAQAERRRLAAVKRAGGTRTASA